MWRYRLFFSAQPVRVILEALVVGGVIWFVVFALMEGLLKTSMPVGQSLFVMGGVMMPWCALRLNRPEMAWWGRRLREAGVVGVVCLAQSALIMVKGNINFLARFSVFSIVMAEPIRVMLMVVGVSVLLFCGNHGIFLLIRAIGRIWTAWNRLRRTRLQWSLTHAHAMVVGMGTILLMAMAAVILAISSQASFARLIIPIFAIVCVLGVMAILAIIPPSALFSYMVVRKTVRRIQMLTEATSALRAGNYAVRVPVLGEDEVAQLQADFNAMAANLEQVMKELQQERDTVSGLLQSRRELVANASHELRTPVATLRGSLETTLMHWEGHSESRLQQDFLVMENEVMHLQTLVENLFTLARADVGRLSLRCEPTEIGLLVERVVKSRAPLAWQAGKIEMVADIQRRGGKAEVDSTRIEQILQNLLHNAERHTGPGGIIVVVVEEEQGKICIHIKDTGEGIAEEELSSIWERAYRRSGDEEGQERETVGLGLALVKEWTEAMGGRISVESVQGEGCCFSVEFAAIQESRVAERPGALSEIK